MNSTGETVIDNSWADKIIPSAVVGIVVFLFTRLWDSWQFEKRMNEIIKSHLNDFHENKIAPLRERVSKFDRTVETLQHSIEELKLLTARIAEKLEVSGK